MGIDYCGLLRIIKANAAQTDTSAKVAPKPADFEGVVSTGLIDVVTVGTVVVVTVGTGVLGVADGVAVTVGT